MKKTYLFILAFVTLLFTSCSSLDETMSNISSALPKKSPEIPLELQEQILTRVNPEQEIYSLGSYKINTSGAIIAQSKANKDAKDLLKSKIKKEVEIYFNSFLLEMDSYSRGLTTPVLSDLNEYASELVLKTATQKGAWENDKKVYSLFVVNRDEIATQSKNVFSSFLSDISGRLLKKTATQKGAWENDKKVYSLFVVNRDEIATQSKNVFSSFLSDISGRLLNTKEKLSVEGE